MLILYFYEKEMFFFQDFAHFKSWITTQLRGSLHLYWKLTTSILQEDLLGTKVKKVLLVFTYIYPK